MDHTELTLPVKMEEIKTEFPETAPADCLVEQAEIKTERDEAASTSFLAETEEIETELLEAALLVADAEIKTEFEEAASTSCLGKRESEEVKTECALEKKKIKTEPDETASTSQFWDPNNTKVDKITAGAKYVNVRGKVIYCTLVHKWESFKCGLKMYFDLADETGIIRVIAWDRFARFAGNLIKLDKTFHLEKAKVKSKHPVYNNLDHPCELELSYGRGVVPSIKELENCPIRATKLQTCFIPFGVARGKRANESFDVSGTIKKINSSCGGEENDLQVIEIQDKKESILKINIWNKYIEISEDMIGKTMDVVRCTYDASHDTINSTGAHINIDGRRVEMYHLASPKIESSPDFEQPLDFFLMARFGCYYDDDYDGDYDNEYDGYEDYYDGGYEDGNEDSDEFGDEDSDKDSNSGGDKEFDDDGDGNSDDVGDEEGSFDDCDKDIDLDGDERSDEGSFHDCDEDIDPDGDEHSDDVSDEGSFENCDKDIDLDEHSDDGGDGNSDDVGNEGRFDDNSDDDCHSDGSESF